MRRFTAAIGAAFLMLAFAGPVAASSSAAHADHYYVSLGDSLAAGEQPIGDPSNGYRTSDGYADQLYAMAQSHYAKLQFVKLGCSGGETTETFINGGICAYDHGSQLDEALAFLKGHAKYTSLITIDIGWNDIDAASPCVIAHPDQALACLAPQLAQIQTNLAAILGALRTVAPGVPIVAMNMYDPFLGFYLIGEVGLAQLSVQLLAGPGGLNDFIEAIYGAFGVPVADVETAFNTTDWTPVPPAGLPDNVTTICAYTWVCAPAPFGPNNHANHDGYAAIAGAFVDTLGW